MQKIKNESNLKDINFPPLDINKIENCKIIIDLSPKDFTNNI